VCFEIGMLLGMGMTASCVQDVVQPRTESSWV
jgi:hypothetical protein